MDDLDALLDLEGAAFDDDDGVFDDDDNVGAGPKQGKKRERRRETKREKGPSPFRRRTMKLNLHSSSIQFSLFSQPLLPRSARSQRETPTWQPLPGR